MTGVACAVLVDKGVYRAAEMNWSRLIWTEISVQFSCVARTVWVHFAKCTERGQFISSARCVSASVYCVHMAVVRRRGSSWSVWEGICGRGWESDVTAARGFNSGCAGKLSATFGSLDISFNECLQQAFYCIFYFQITEISQNLGHLSQHFPISWSSKYNRNVQRLSVKTNAIDICGKLNYIIVCISLHIFTYVITFLAILSPLCIYQNVVSVSICTGYIYFFYFARFSGQICLFPDI